MVKKNNPAETWFQISNLAQMKTASDHSPCRTRQAATSRKGNTAHPVLLLSTHTHTHKAPEENPMSASQFVSSETSMNLRATQIPEPASPQSTPFFRSESPLNLLGESKELDPGTGAPAASRAATARSVCFANSSHSRTLPEGVPDTRTAPSHRDVTSFCLK